jgi:hypothetical protein
MAFSFWFDSTGRGIIFDNLGGNPLLCGSCPCPNFTWPSYIVVRVIATGISVVLTINGYSGGLPIWTGNGWVFTITSGCTGPGGGLASGTLSNAGLGYSQNNSPGAFTCIPFHAFFPAAGGNGPYDVYPP